MSEEKENGDGVSYPRNKLSPDMRYAGSGSSGRGSPARGFRRDVSDEREARNESAPGGMGYTSYGDRSGSRTGNRAEGRPGNAPSTGASTGSGMESWKRAAEVTSQLKARIEQMKVRQQSVSETQFVPLQC